MIRNCISGENDSVVIIRVAPLIVPIERDKKPVIQCNELVLKKISFALIILKLPKCEINAACDRQISANKIIQCL